MRSHLQKLNLDSSRYPLHIKHAGSCSALKVSMHLARSKNILPTHQPTQQLLLVHKDPPKQRPLLLPEAVVYVKEAV